MPVNAAQLQVKVGADTGEAESKLAAMGAQVASAGAAIGAFALVAGGAMIVAGVKSVLMAGDFQAGMTSLVTGAGEAQSNLKMVSDGVLKMAVDTGTSTQQLTAGMYNIDSANIHGKASLVALGDAARGAKVGVADLGTVADAMTTVMTDYKDSNITSAQAVNGLIATVANGKTHMNDLAGAMSHVLPIASSFGVSLNDVEGAMATMTGEGVPAADAATYLGQMLKGLASPTSAASKALESIGLSARQVNADMKESLPATLQEITDAVGKKFPAGSLEYNKALIAIAGGQKNLNAMLDLGGTHLDQFKANVTSVGDAVKNGGKSIIGWSDVQGDFNFKLDQAKEVIGVMAIKLGTLLLPVIGQLATLFTSVVMPAMIGFTDALSKPSQGMQMLAQVIKGAAMGALSQLGTFIMGVVVPAATQFGSYFAKNIIPLMGQMAQIIMSDVVPAIVSIATFIIKDVIPAAEQFSLWFDKTILPVLRTLAEVIKTDVVPTVESIASTIMTKLIPPIENLIGKITPILIPAFRLIGWVLQNVVGPALNIAITIIGWLIGTLGDIIGVIGDLLGWFGNLKDGIGRMFGAIGDFLGSVLGKLGQFKDNAVKSISDLVINVVNGIESLPGKIAGGLASIGTKISSTWDGILAGAANFGRGIVQHVIDGISGLIGQLGSAAGRIGDTIKNAVNNIPGIGGIANWAGFAEGTDNAPGGLAMVGEKGPELVYLPKGAQVTPNNRLNSIAGGGGASGGNNGGRNSASNGGIAQPVNLVLDGRTLATAILPYLADAIRYNVGTHS